ncbi:hypothetical protein [Aureivirga sp. CE67]|uniref:hypothetical protein n=1 Tax=Aureivirga sp. CE67 TaxID=1788983 RepID=UPI0018C9B96C|nr:hypothetical protein [Aureivirga sp. CE67]
MNLIVNWSDGKPSPYLYKFLVDGEKYEIDNAVSKKISLKRGKHQFRINNFWLKSKTYEFDLQDENVEIKIESNLKLINQLIFALFFAVALVCALFQASFIIYVVAYLASVLLLKLYTNFFKEKFLKINLKK